MKMNCSSGSPVLALLGSLFLRQVIKHKRLLWSHCMIAQTHQIPPNPCTAHQSLRAVQDGGRGSDELNSSGQLNRLTDVLCLRPQNVCWILSELNFLIVFKTFSCKVLHNLLRVQEKHPADTQHQVAGQIMSVKHVVLQQEVTLFCMKTLKIHHSAVLIISYVANFTTKSQKKGHWNEITNERHPELEVIEVQPRKETAPRRCFPLAHHKTDSQHALQQQLTATWSVYLPLKSNYQQHSRWISKSKSTVLSHRGGATNRTSDYNVTANLPLCSDHWHTPLRPERSRPQPRSLAQPQNHSESGSSCDLALMEKISRNVCSRQKQNCTEDVAATTHPVWS